MGFRLLKEAHVGVADDTVLVGEREMWQLRTLFIDKENTFGWVNSSGDLYPVGAIRFCHSAVSLVARIMTLHTLPRGEGGASLLF